MQTLRENTTLQGEKYRIISVLGQGGFGITYLAEQTMLERRVAIKEFYMKELCSRDGSTSHVTIGTEGSRETVTRFREKFLKEARNIAKLNHPNIVKIIDVFEENGTAYYVMEYAEGGSLADKVKREGYLSESVATRYIMQVAEALAYVHARKMNHLDVKPANIMLTGTDTAVLIDFGLSKQYNVGGQQTSTTPVGISEGYAPMEQYKQGGVGEFSPETDIYALGATFFKLLTGKTPPSASDVNEDGVPVDELKAKGVSDKSIEVICEAMKSRKKERMKDVKSFIGAFGNNKRNASAKVEEDEVTRIKSETKPNSVKGKSYSLASPPPPKPPRFAAEGTYKKVNSEEPEGVFKGLVKGCLITILVIIPIVGIIIGIAQCENNRSNTPTYVNNDDTNTVEEYYVEEYAIKDGAGNILYYWTGNLKNDQPEGEGVAEYRTSDKYSRSKYSGRMSKGLKEGVRAVLTYKNGDQFVGDFANDHFKAGTYTVSSSGESFVGDFNNDQPYNGKWYDKNGKVIQTVINGK